MGRRGTDERATNSWQDGRAYMLTAAITSSIAVSPAMQEDSRLLLLCIDRGTGLTLMHKHEQDRSLEVSLPADVERMRQATSSTAFDSRKVLSCRHLPGCRYVPVQGTVACRNLANWMQPVRTTEGQSRFGCGKAEVVATLRATIPKRTRKLVEPDERLPRRVDVNVVRPRLLGSCLAQTTPAMNGNVHGMLRRSSGLRVATFMPSKRCSTLT